MDKAHVNILDASSLEERASKALSTPFVRRKIDMSKASTIKPESISWIWNDWLARGKIHILAGMAGTGKTTLSLSIAATISNGGFFADGSKAEIGNVIIWSGEDDAASTMVILPLVSGVEK